MSEVKGVPIKINGENYSSLAHATLSLFHALPVGSSKKSNPSAKITKLTINHGFIFSPQVAGNYTEKELISLIDTIADEIGLTPDQMNNSFHKSWGKVRDASWYQLVCEQAMHYMTTYGYEAMGSYNENTVFIPNERLDVPEVKDGIKLTIIKGYTKNQLKEKLLNILNSGLALKSIDPMVEIAKFVKITEDEVLKSNNKEVRVKLYKELDLIPENPLELLRLAIFETTERTLLINNKATTELIKKANKDMSDLFEQYDDNFGYVRLAEIFKRFKPLFLAFKVNGNMTGIINKISHLSDKHHRPMKQSLLNNITGMLSRGEKISPTKLEEELDRVNIFRKIRLAQSLKYRMLGNESIMYKIRNGKSFATTMEFKNTPQVEKTFNALLKSIAGDLKHLKGKEFYIPENLVYALPATEKQFTGNVPSGSYVSIGKDMIFGVYWENHKGKKQTQQTYNNFGYNHDYDNGRVDLDLSAMSIHHGKVGWDAQYRTGNRSLMFSGDVTDAPDGATELFYISDAHPDTMLLTVNYFNFNPDKPVPFKLMLAEEHPARFERNYTIDPNHMKFVLKSTLDTKQKVLGLATVREGECRFYFNESSLGNSISIRGGKYVSIAQDYLAHFSTNQISFNDVLKLVGAKIVTTPTKKSIDLSIEALEKDTFINLLIKQ